MTGEQEFVCPKCGHKFVIDLGPEDASGDTMFCPKCNRMMQVPRRAHEPDK